MGYYSYFDMRFDGDNELIEKAIEFLSEKSGYNIDNCGSGYFSVSEVKWYECDADFAKLAEDFPELCGEIVRSGEDSEDREQYYIHKGHLYSGMVKFVYPSLEELIEAAKE